MALSQRVKGYWNHEHDHEKTFWLTVTVSHEKIQMERKWHHNISKLMLGQHLYTTVYTPSATRLKKYPTYCSLNQQSSAIYLLIQCLSVGTSFVVLQLVRQAMLLRRLWLRLHLLLARLLMLWLEPLLVNNKLAGHATWEMGLSTKFCNNVP